MALLKNLKLVIGLSKKGLTKLNADLRRTKHNFKRNFGEISALAGKAGMAIAAGVGAGLTAVIKSGAQLQTLKVGFRSIMGSAEGAAEMVGKLNKFTATTPFRLEEVSRSARQLIAVGVKMDDVNERMRMLGDIAAASGNSIGDIAAAFSKVQAKGKVELENRNQLAERGIPIFDELKKVTGDANMEFGAGSVTVDQYNQALANMASEGGFAEDAMKNLSETVSGKFSTAMDNMMLALGEFAEESGLLAFLTQELDGITGMLQRFNTGNDDVNASLKESEDLLKRVEKAHKGNADALSKEADEAKTAAMNLNQILGTDASALALAKATEVADAAWSQFMESLTSSPNLPDAPAPTAPTQTLEEFKAQFKAAAALTKAKQELAASQSTMAFGAEEEAEALQAMSNAYGNLTDGIIEMVEVEEESPIMDEDTQQRIQDGTKQLQNLARASQMTGQVFNFMGNMVNAAFDNIKDKSQGFHEVIKAMLESLLKRAIALAATFAALMLITGGTSKALAATGAKSFGGFMMGGLGVPQMADGGMFTGASLAMVGEGPGTSAINPEVVAPLNKLRDMMGGGNVTVTGMIRGSDILISNERSQIDRNRVRGF